MKLSIFTLYVLLVLKENTNVSDAEAIITNEQVVLGVNDCAALNVPYEGISSWGDFDPTRTNFVGIRDHATGRITGVERGCLCEGWTAMVSEGNGFPVWCGENIADGGTKNIRGCRFRGENGETTAFSQARCAMETPGPLQLVVSHRFQPSSVPELYEVIVKIRNPTMSDYPKVLYQRSFDWDIDPSPFNEFVTIQGSAACPDVVTAHNDGFCGVDPEESCGERFGSRSGDFVDNGPRDQGTTFRFDLGPLAKKKSLEFTFYYGVAGPRLPRPSPSSEEVAINALNAVRASVFSLGQSRRGGDPYTFMFGYKCCKDDNKWRLTCEDVAADPETYCGIEAIAEECACACFKPTEFCGPCGCRDVNDPGKGGDGGRRGRGGEGGDGGDGEASDDDGSDGGCGTDGSETGFDGEPGGSGTGGGGGGAGVVGGEPPRTTDNDDWTNKNLGFTCETDPNTLCTDESVGAEARAECPEACEAFVE